MAEFESLGLKAGIWSGLLRRPAAPARVRLVHLGQTVGEANITGLEAGIWRVDAALPPTCLSDGVQSVLLIADESEDSPGGELLADLSIVAGRPLDFDLRAEIDLVRAELDLLKREFRRLAAMASQG